MGFQISIKVILNIPILVIIYIRFLILVLTYEITYLNVRKSYKQYEAIQIVIILMDSFILSSIGSLFCFIWEYLVFVFIPARGKYFTCNLRFASLQLQNLIGNSYYSYTHPYEFFMDTDITHEVLKVQLALSIVLTA